MDHLNEFKRRGKDSGMELNNITAELTGIIIGDGCLYGNFNSYCTMITGHPDDDKEFYEILRKNINSIIGRDPRIKIHQRALRLIVTDKKFFNFFVEDLGMKYDGDKCHNVTIPEVILKNKELAISCIRGIFDTDGSVFTSKKAGSPKYPCIELTTVSKNLARQVYNFLKENGYRVNTIRERDRRPVGGMAYVIVINGWNMLKKWYLEIGFTNPVKKRKAKNILIEKFGSVE